MIKETVGECGFLIFSLNMTEITAPKNLTVESCANGRFSGSSAPISPKHYEARDRILSSSSLHIWVSITTKGGNIRPNSWRAMWDGIYNLFLSINENVYEEDEL